MTFLFGIELVSSRGVVSPHQPLAFEQILHQRPIEIRGRIDQRVIDLILPALALEPGEIIVDLFLHRGAEVVRLGGQLAAGFDVLKNGVVAKIETIVQRVENLKNEHLVLAMPEMLQARQHLGRLGVQIAWQKIREHDDEAAALDLFSNLVQRRGPIRGAGGLGVLQLAEQRRQIALHRARRQIAGDAFVEQHQAHGVTLVNHQIAQRRSKIAGVIELADFAGVGDSHRRRLIDEYITFEIGFFFKLFHVKAVGFAVDFPIDVANLVAGHILPVFGKFDAEAVIRAAVQAGDEAFDDQARAQIHVGQARDRGGMKVFAIEGFGGHSEEESNSCCVIHENMLL